MRPPYLISLLPVLIFLTLLSPISPATCPHGQIYSFTQSRCVSCFFACDSCTANNYYSCTVCKPGRGNNGLPISGMCYCSNKGDEDESGNCIPSGSSQVFRSVITALIILILLFSLFAAVVKSNRFFLFRLIQDMQQVSLFVLINLYFPEQLDGFFSQLYNWNFTSVVKLFEAMDKSTFSSGPYEIMNAQDQTIPGKYLFLYKSSNFLSNSFNLIFLWGIVVGLMFLLSFLKRKFVQKYGTNGKYHIIDKTFNVFYIGMVLNVFYFSLIQLNLNIAIQFSNPPFSSNFSRFGIAMAVVMMLAQGTAFFFMFKYFRQEMSVRTEFRNPHLDTMWRDLSQIQTLLSKYFWFIGCIKNIIYPVIITALYTNTESQLLGMAIFQGLWTAFCVAISPYNRKYMRLHLYINQTFKFLITIAFINFQQQYVQYQSVISIVHIVYVLIILMLFFSLLFLLGHLLVESQVYWYSIKRLMGKDPESGRGVFINGKLYVYDDEMAAEGEKMERQPVENETVYESGIQNNLSFGNFEASEEIMNL